MHAFLTVRNLKPGRFEEWRRAWEPEEWPQGAQKAFILRNVGDPDQVIAFGFFDTPLEHLQSDPRLREQQQVRLERMAPHVDSTEVDGVYEVVEEVTP